MKEALEAGQMAARSLAPAIGAVVVERGRRSAAAVGSRVDGIDPEARDPRSSEPRRQYIDGRVVGVQHRARHGVGTDQPGQRRQPPGGMANPVGQGDPVDVDALPRQDCRLAIERQAVAVLRDDDVGDQSRTRPTLLDRQVGCGRLEDPLAAATGVFRPNMPDDLVPGRNPLEHLGDILAHPDEPVIGAVAGDLGLVDDDLPRQMRRQRLAQRRSPWPGFSFLPGRLRGGLLGLVLLEVLEPQLELVNRLVEPLRGVAEPGSP